MRGLSAETSSMGIRVSFSGSGRPASRASVPVGCSHLQLLWSLWRFSGLRWANTLQPNSNEMNSLTQNTHDESTCDNSMWVACYSLARKTLAFNMSHTTNASRMGSTYIIGSVIVTYSFDSSTRLKITKLKFSINVLSSRRRRLLSE